MKSIGKWSVLFQLCRAIIHVMVDARTPQQRRRDGAAMQAIEGNPLTADDLAMFEMFDRQGWSPERRRAYIIQLALKRVPAIAAE